MKSIDKYQTVYETSNGLTSSSHFQDSMTFEEAEAKGKKYCKDNNYEYLKTVKSHFK